VRLRAWWDPGWYNLDQSLKLGERARFAFVPGKALPSSGFDLVFAHTLGGGRELRSATVDDIEHARFGRVEEVDTSQFGQYTFRFVAGWWVTIETEEAVGHLNAVSSDPPVTHFDREWAYTSGWALAVTLSDVDEPSYEDRSRLR
jgi:hypothetical protein